MKKLYQIVIFKKYVILKLIFMKLVVSMEKYEENHLVKKKELYRYQLFLKMLSSV